MEEADKDWMIILITLIQPNNILFIDVSASRRKPSSGLTSGDGHQYVKACPIRGSTGSSPRLDSCCRSSWSISPPLWVCQLCLILDQSPWRSPSLSHDSHCNMICDCRFVADTGCPGLFCSSEFLWYCPLLYDVLLLLLPVAFLFSPT